MIFRIFLLVMLCIGKSAFAQVPPNATPLPCNSQQVEEEYCERYETGAGGGKICVKWSKVCVPGVTNPGGGSSGVEGCVLNTRTCEDRTPFKMINSVKVTLDMVGGCWSWKRDYTCETQNKVNTCSQFANDSKCAVFSRKCIDSVNGSCKEWEVQYNCLTKPSESYEVEYCGDTNICIGGICWDTGYLPDEDFASVITDMETAREIGTYSPDGLNIFGGVGETCRSKRAAGLKSCCSSNTSARSNNKVMGEFISGASGFAVRAGSKYVFDTLYGDTLNWISSGWASAVSGNLPGGQNLLDGIASPGFGMYGFSIGGTGSFLGTSGSFLGTAGGFEIYFNPYSFAFAIGMNIIMSAMTCSQEEALLAMKRGAGLCSPKIEEWCTKKILGVCITRKRSYCCYNSKIARIINTQGREQLGWGWGNGRNPSCEGFNEIQLQSIDFSRIDMSEFVGDVMGAIDKSHFVSEREQSINKDYQSTALKEACQQSLRALGGDKNKLPKECQSII